MSEKTRIRELMLEYSERSTGQGVPHGPGDGAVSTSNPNIVTGDTMYKASPSYDAADKKVFDDEQKAYGDAFVMPYTLDRINDAMISIVNGAAEARVMMDQTLEHPSLNEPQLELLKRQVKMLSKIQKATIKIIHDLDNMTITSK